jgi:glycosyltransferase involved in cell wall biosynthesis
MKVKDLIKDSIWRPGKLYDPKVKPAISVLLPTFRRGKSGLFRRAVNSVLNQTLEDIELIIIDDASTDGTADQIEEFMRKDGRVSVITHPRNIGLPAISEYEGYMRARADYFAFAFDDDFFYPDALEKLLEHAEKNPDMVCYGHVLMRIREPGFDNEQLVPFGQALNSGNVRSINPLSNNAVLLPRNVVEDVGLYDPRIIMARQCDWDLWRRIDDKYLLHHVDVAVGEVEGPATKDSIGHTYRLDSWASEELMRSDRTAELRPDIFEECDVETSPFCETDTLSRAVYREFYSDYLANRPWLGERDVAVESSEIDGSILVITSSHNASTSLCFDYLPKNWISRVRVIQIPGAFGVTELARASCLIVVRSFEDYRDWLRSAKQLRLPVYYFLDDNFPELARESYSFDEDFSRIAIRERLREFDGVLLSSKKLVDYFEAHLMHPNLLYFPPCYCGGAAALPNALDEEKHQTISKHGASAKTTRRIPTATGSQPNFDLTVASVGGAHRHSGLTDFVIPALRRLASKEQKIHLIIGGCSGEAEEELQRLASDDLTITGLPFEIEWKRALLQLARYRPQILLHGPSNTANSDYKTLNAALGAHLLDAVLVAPRQAPFDDPAFAGCARLVDTPGQAKSWLSTLADLLSEHGSWKEYKMANAKYCRRHFSGEENVVIFENMLRNAPRITLSTVENRLKTLYRTLVNSAAAVSSADLHSLNTSLTELARMRKSHRRYRNLRFFLGRDDLWAAVSPAFGAIRADILERGARKRGMKLELSDSLHDRPYAEYRLTLPAGTLRSISCALASEGIHPGNVCVEIISSDGTKLSREELDLSGQTLHAPVSFNVEPITFSEPSDVRVRFFAETKWPLYILELVSYRGFRRRPVTPFASFDYDEDS